MFHGVLEDEAEDTVPEDQLVPSFPGVPISELSNAQQQKIDTVKLYNEDLAKQRQMRIKSLEIELKKLQEGSKFIMFFFKKVEYHCKYINNHCCSTPC